MDTLNCAVETISHISIQRTSGQSSVEDSNNPLTPIPVTITLNCLPFRHAYPFKAFKEDNPKPPFRITFSMSDHDEVCFIECLQRRIPVRIGHALPINADDMAVGCIRAK